MFAQSHDLMPPGTGAIACRVVTTTAKGPKVPISNARIRLYAAHLKACCDLDVRNWKNQCLHVAADARTATDGELTFESVQPGIYIVQFGHYPPTDPVCVEVRAGCIQHVCVDVDLGLAIETTFEDQNCKPIPCDRPRRHDRFHTRITIKDRATFAKYVRVNAPPGVQWMPGSDSEIRGVVEHTGRHKLPFGVELAQLEDLAGGGSVGEPANVEVGEEFDADEAATQRVEGQMNTTLGRTATAFTDDLALWQAILNSTEALSFNSYLAFMNTVFCGDEVPPNLPPFERQRFATKRQEYDRLRAVRLLPFTDTDAYRVVKAATEAFVMVNCGVISSPQPFAANSDAAYFARRDLPFPAGGLRKVLVNDYLEPFAGGDPGTRTLPYLAVIRQKLPDIAIKFNAFDIPPQRASQCHGILQEKLVHPCLLELIWSYWHEEGMLVQTVNALTRRFQNVRAPGSSDPLANLEIDPLRPLNNILWGYVQDEQHRLSVVRRNYEYDHHYGLRLHGKAVRDMAPADSRSKFLGAFHNLLRLCTVFFRQDDDTTVKADAFPVLNALKEVHLILSQGAHNQFGDLPSTARVEMLMQQWMLARPEFREFLPTRLMVAYPEPWMDRVDAMKKLQGWTDTSVLHFRNLALFGEQVVLAIRYGFWSDVQDPLQAFNWARFFRPQIQGYLHAYRSVTGMDLTGETVSPDHDATLPAVLLQRQLAAQQRGA